MTVPAAPSLTWTFLDGDWHEGNVPIMGPRSHAAWLASQCFDGARWFDGVARLYPLKALALGTLAVFWIASGLVALTSFAAARDVLVLAGFPLALATAITWISSLADIAIGVLIAHRRTARLGLWAGIATSVFYLVGAAILTPAMWLEPLGALVKTFPAIVLMGVCLATLDDR